MQLQKRTVRESYIILCVVILFVIHSLHKFQTYALFSSNYVYYNRKSYPCFPEGITKTGKISSTSFRPSSSSSERGILVVNPTRYNNHPSRTTSCALIMKMHNHIITIEEKEEDESKTRKKENKKIQIAYKNLHHDLSSMRSLRISKFNVLHHETKEINQNKNIVSQKANKQELYYNLMKDHPILYELYNQKDHLYVTNLTQVVGPMYRCNVEKMIQSHPRMVSNILLSIAKNNEDEEGISSITSTRRCIRSVQAQIIHDLNLSQKDQIQLRTLFDKKSSITSKISRKNIRAIFHTLQTQLQLSSSDHSKQYIQKVFFKTPKLFTYSNINIQQSITYLQNKDVGFSNEDICKMIQIRPMVLTNCAGGKGTKIDLIIKLFRDDLNLDYKNILIRYPQLFDYNAKNLEEKSRYLQKVLKLHRYTDLSSILSSFPPLLWLSKTNIEEKVSFLVKEFELDDDDLRDIIVSYPKLLGLSIRTNLCFKIDYFLDDGYGDVLLSRQKLKELVLYQPALLAYSLDKRIKPRIRKLRENYISFCYAPPYLMSLPDAKFNEWLEIQKSTWSIN